MTYVEKIALEFSKGCNATDDSIYLPVECIGRTINIAMAMEREIKKLKNELECISKNQQVNNGDRTNEH